MRVGGLVSPFPDGCTDQCFGSLLLDTLLLLWDDTTLCQPGFGQAVAWKPPTVHTPPFPRQSVLVLHCPPGEAPKAAKCSYCSLLYCLALWWNCFFLWLWSSLFRQCRQWSCGSTSLFAKSPQPERATEPGHWWCLCAWAEHVDLCGCVCVYVHSHCSHVHTCMCLRLVHAQPCYWLVLEAWEMQHLSSGPLDLANPNSHNHSPRSVFSTALLKMESVTI